MTATPCPSDDALLAYAAGTASADEAAVIAQHVDGCSICLAILATAGKAMLGSLAGEGDLAPPAPAPVEPAAPTLRPGDKLGRYHLLEELGRGAMGVVFAAYDPDLDRKVAVKLVMTRARGGIAAAEIESRSVREAQAMARLAHDHVVTVHDIGLVPGGVYMAMELVSGQTLRAWLAEKRRSWREILRVLLEAGEGLAAAHAAGIVHRDFKPDNVLVGRDGKARVTDFGLSRVSQRGIALDEAVPVQTDLFETRAGTLVGTPAYMAPEQLRSDADVDARADVFAFGAVAYEALFGVRPYPASTLGELEAMLARGMPAEPPPSKVPRRIRAALTRALLGDRERRIGDMPTLLARLRADPLRRSLAFAAPIAAVALALGLWLGLRTDADAAPRLCFAGAERAASLLSGERVERVRAAFEEAASGGRALEIVLATLGAHLDAWADARRDACAATFERHEQSEHLLELRIGCLDQRLAETDAFIAELERADPAIVLRAPRAVGDLPSPAICRELDRLRSRVPPPTEPALRHLARAAGSIRAKATAADLSGRWQAGAVMARLAHGLAEGSTDLPARAEATYTLARLAQLAGALEEARTRFPVAIALALEAADDRVTAEAMIGLVYLFAIGGTPPEEPVRWATLAESLITRLGGDDELTLRLLMARASVLLNSREAERALSDYRRAAAIQERLDGVDAPSLVLIHQGIGGALRELERFEASLASLARAETIALRTLDPKHPEALNMAANMTFALSLAGYPDEALKRLDALRPAILEAFGPRHWNYSGHLLQRGLALTLLGRHDETIAACQEALAIDDALFKDNRARLAYSHLCMSHAHLGAGRGPDALTQAELALAITHEHAASNQRLINELHLLRALALEYAGRDAEAKDEAERTARAIEAMSGESTDLARAEGALGRADLREGRVAEAITRFERALAIMTSRHGTIGAGRVPALIDLAAGYEAAARWPEANALLTEAQAILQARAVDPILDAETRFAQARLGCDPDALDAALAIADALPYPRAERLRAASFTWLAGAEASCSQ